jgi:hypothetical protein
MKYDDESGKMRESVSSVLRHYRPMSSVDNHILVRLAFAKSPAGRQYPLDGQL